MKIISTSYTQNNNHKKSINFKNRDYFVKIKQLPEMSCGCCGKKVLSIDKYIDAVTSMSKPLKFILSRGKLDYVQKAFPEAWKTLIKFASKYPEQTLDEITEAEENYVKLKVNIANELVDPNIEENSREQNYLDRYIGKCFFDLFANSRCMMKESSIVIKNFLPLKSYLHGEKKEAFELLENYSKIYPDKTFREIVEQVHTFHEKRDYDFRQNKILEINQYFSNIKNIIKEKAPKMSEIMDLLEKQSWEILKTENDPSCRKYKIKQLYTENFKKNGCEKILPLILQEIEKIPVVLVNADTFFVHAYWKNFSDGKIIDTIFSPIFSTEEHIIRIANHGVDRTGNKTVLCKECNDLRKDNYDIFVEYHPEMLENYQKQINIVTDSLINEELGEDFRFYPFTIAQTLKNDSKGKIDLDLVSYSKVMLKRSKQKLIKLEKEIEILTEKRDDTICLALKTTPELMATISKKIEDINTEMQATRDKIWTEKNLQNIIHDYLKGRKG